MQAGGGLMIHHQKEGGVDGRGLAITAAMDAPTLIRTITGLRYEIENAVKNLRYTARRMNQLPGYMNTWKAKSEYVLKELEDETLSPQQRKHSLETLKDLQRGIFQEFFQNNKIDQIELPSRIQEVNEVYARNDHILKIVLEAVLPRLR
jgi:hypothetical protein